MHDSNWSIRDTIVVSLFGLFAVGVLAAAIYAMGYSKATHRAEAQNYASQYPADTDERIDNCPTNSALVLRECIEEIIASAHDAQRSEQDLNAQRDMAQWAWWLLVVSLAQVPLGIAGLTVLLLTLRQGQDSLNKAREANEIARNAFIAGNRAWLMVKKVDVSRLKYSFEEAGVLVSGDIFFIVENTGRSAASEIWSRSVIGPMRGIWGKLNEEVEIPHYPECLPPGGLTKASASLCMMITPNADGKIRLDAMRAAISLTYFGGGPDSFMTECLFSISSFDGGTSGWNENLLRPFFGEYGSLKAHAVFQYFRTVT